MATDDEFPDDFFPNVDHLLHNMTLGDCAVAIANASSSSIVMYVFLSSSLGFAFGLLAVEIDMDMMLILFIIYCIPRFNNLFPVSIAMSIIFYQLFFN